MAEDTARTPPMTATAMTMDGIDREIKSLERAISSLIVSLRGRLDEAEHILADGRTPSACGVVQGLGVELDMKVARLDQAKEIRAKLRSAAAFDAKEGR